MFFNSSTTLKSYISAICLYRSCTWSTRPYKNFRKPNQTVIRLNLPHNLTCNVFKSPLYLFPFLLSVITCGKIIDKSGAALTQNFQHTITIIFTNVWLNFCLWQSQKVLHFQSSLFFKTSQVMINCVYFM